MVVTFDRGELCIARDQCFANKERKKLIIKTTRKIILADFIYLARYLQTTNKSIKQMSGYVLG